MGQRLIHYDFWDATRRPIGRVHGAFYRQSTRHEEKIGALVANVVLALRSLGSVSAALTCIHYLHLGTLEEAQSLLDALIIGDFESKTGIMLGPLRSSIDLFRVFHTGESGIARASEFRGAERRQACSGQ
ncbi:predicted protein [Coccidioides posadasii str. Silveira]|uniref:Predicted protein n=1 Tax=Coccidioides posadasii (strain RMSCC 757 / Silveira) TaxID=443226 RepID=E9DDE1_COCPS|nr:predicted protein [Coccidioides posadasii str. Silveira]